MKKHGLLSVLLREEIRAIHLPDNFETDSTPSKHIPGWMVMVDKSIYNCLDLLTWSFFLKGGDSIFIPLKVSDEYIKIPLEELPPVEDIIDVINSETPPIETWLEVAVIILYLSYLYNFFRVCWAVLTVFDEYLKNRQHITSEINSTPPKTFWQHFRKLYTYSLSSKIRGGTCQY